MNQTDFDTLTEQSKNTISAKVICDSVNPDGCRLTTMEWNYPRMIHSEIMTHRKLSRNAASSRAIPLAKMIQRVQSTPVFPIHWGANQKGMQADKELEPEQKLYAGQRWIEARDNAINSAALLESMGVHKQIGNRLLEPWMWITVIVSATNFENLFALRCHPAAEPHFQNLAYKVRQVYDKSIPTKCPWGEWHLPYFSPVGGGFSDDLFSNQADWPKISAGRCARVSYLTHEGKRDPAEDIRLYEQLSTHQPMHASPLEHPAVAFPPHEVDILNFKWQGLLKKNQIPNGDWGNYDPGWWQLRKMFPDECVTKRV